MSQEFLLYKPENTPYPTLEKPNQELVAVFPVPFPAPFPVDLPLDRGWAVSPSQLETFSLCRRKWAWRYLANIIEPQNKSAALGDAVHKQLENYLLTGTLPDQSTQEGEIATAGLHFLPAPMTPGLEIEQKFRFTSPRGNTYTGRKDYALHPSVRGWPVVGDHKTTSDFKWAKSEEDLLENFQANVYAAESMLRFGADQAELEWTYYRTRGPAKSKQVRLKVFSDSVEKQFFTIDNLTDEIHRLRASGKGPLEVEANPEACESFGGCPHRHRCNMSPQERMFSIMTNGTSDLLARLQTQAAADTAPKAPAPAVAAPAPPPPPAGSVLEQLRARQAAANAALLAGQPATVPSMSAVTPLVVAPPPPPPAPPPAPAPPPTATIMSMPAPPAPAPVVTAPTPTPGTWYADSAGNPVYPCACGMHVTVDTCKATGGVCPQCQNPIAGASIFMEGHNAEINPPEHAKARAASAAAPPPASTTTPPASDKADGGSEGKGKRGRPKLPRDEHGNIVRTKSDPNMPAVTTPPAPTVAPSPSAAPVQMSLPVAPPSAPTAPPPVSVVVTAPAPAAPAAPNAKPIGILLIDTLPVGGACVSADSEVFTPCRQAIKNIHGVDDYRMMEFGKGPGVFSAAVTSWLEQSGKTWDVMYVDSRSADAMHVLPVLTAHANVVFRGMA